MTWFWTVFHRNRRLLNFGLEIFLIILIVFSGNTARPFLGNLVLSIFHYPFAELKESIEGLHSVAEENRNLKNILAESNLQRGFTEEARRENIRLREFLGFDPPENFTLVPVKIVSLEQNRYPYAAVINKGKNDFIDIDCPVVNRFGLVGKVKETMREFATVQLLTDPSNAVSARTVESRQIGIVRYVPSEGMIFDNLPADAVIDKGDQIISSGLGGVYPSGLSIALVDSVLANKGEIKKQVWLRPNVNFNEIEELFVLKSVGK